MENWAKTLVLLKNLQENVREVQFLFQKEKFDLAKAPTYIPIL